MTSKTVIDVEDSGSSVLITDGIAQDLTDFFLRAAAMVFGSSLQLRLEVLVKLSKSGSEPSGGDITIATLRS